MNDNDLIQALRRITMETGSLVCLGCGHEHNCSTHGCAVINEAIERLSTDHLTTLGGTYVSIEWFKSVEADLEKYKDTGLEPERVAELAQAEKDGRLVVLLPESDEKLTVEEIAEMTGYKCQICAHHSLCTMPGMRPMCGEIYDHFEHKGAKEAQKSDD